MRFVLVGADDRRDGGNRRIAADRIAAGDQDREPGRQLEHAADAEAEGQRHDDDPGNRTEQGRAGRCDRCS